MELGIYLSNMKEVEVFVLVLEEGIVKGVRWVIVFMMGVVKEVIY